MKVKNGSLLAETRTSIYEIKISNIEDKIPSLLTERIESNPEEFPDSLQRIIRSNPEALELAEKIDDNLFVFSQTKEDKAIAAVKDKSGTWHTRLFHRSGSDRQWKAVPYVVSGRHKKGNERDANHHYVQSGKLTKEVHEGFNKTSHKDRGAYTVSRYNPITDDSEEEFFSENNISFENEDWKNSREDLQKYLEQFIALSNNDLSGLSTDNNFGIFCKEIAGRYDFGKKVKRNV